MSESMKDRLLEARDSNKVKYVNLYNDGSMIKDQVWYAKHIQDFSNDYTAEDVKQNLCRVAEYYSNYYDYDYIQLNLLLGLIFDSADVDSENHIKPGARPMNDIVRIYTEKSYCSLDGKQTNEKNAYEHVRGFQSYAKYDDFVQEMVAAGLTFNGPETFDNFLLKMATGIPFEISVSMDLREKEIKKEEDIVVEKPVVVDKPKSRRRSLFSKRG